MREFGTLFRWHLRREAVRLLVLCVAVGGVMGLLVGISGSVRPAEVQEVFEKIPAAFRAMLGMEEGAVLTLDRWVGLVHGHPLWLILVLVFPIAAALKGIAGGIESGALEVILAQPLSRGTYYASLAALVTTGVTATIVSSALGGLLVAALVELPDAFPAGLLLKLSFSGWLLGMAVGGLCLLVSAARVTGGKPGAWALGLVLGFFFLRFLANMWPAAAGAGWLSIFSYHDPGRVIKEGLELLPVAVLAGVALGCGAAGRISFGRRQLSF